MFPYFSGLVQADDPASRSSSASDAHSPVRSSVRPKLNVLVIYDHYSTHIKTVQDHVRSFREFSRHHVYYAPGTHEVPLHFDVNRFDVIIVHYSVRMAFDWHMSKVFREAITAFEGLKVLFIQDEYDFTWQSSRMINELGIRVVFSCVPQQHVRQIYSKVDPRVEFFNVLTGYLPIDPPVGEPRPIASRPILLGYRGRKGLDRYGSLAREKYLIGVKMREICDARGIPCDIEWDENKRIYGDDWFRFLCDCKVTLGAESGSNVFDFDGSLDRMLKDAVQEKPDISYEELHARFVAAYERPDTMNQISPRIFESIMAKSALVLFEGKYSGVLQPHTHFIPLRKDFGNIDEVLTKIHDDRYLQRLANAAYDHVIGSGEFTYARFVENVDQVIDARAKKRTGVQRYITTVIAIEHPASDVVQPMHLFTDPIGEKLMKTLSSLCSSPANVADPARCEFRISATPDSPYNVGEMTTPTLFLVPVGTGKISLYKVLACEWKSYRQTTPIEIPMAQLQPNCNYDVFVHHDENHLAAKVVSWPSDHVRTTALSRIDGILVHSDQPGHRYVGTFRTDENGQVTDRPASRSIWNYQNRVGVSLQNSLTGDHAFESREWRAWNDDARAKVEFLVGFVEEPVTLTLGGNVYGGDGMLAMGINAPVGFSPTIRNANPYILEGSVSRIEVPAMGWNRVHICEYGGPGFRSSMAILSGAFQG